MATLTRSRLLLAACSAAALLAAAPAAAQSDILLQLRSGSPAGDRVRVDSAGGFVALGTLGIGIIPASGNASNGVRMMWYPFRGVFRAGTPGSSGSTAWDDANLGFYSWAGGSNTRATQYATFAFGDGAEATSSYAVAFGASTEVSGSYGFGAGYNVRCAATACTAHGYVANADGLGATAIGYRVTADANYSTAIGYRASTNGRTGAFVISDASTTDSTEASANNQFRARFAGGYRFYTNATQTSGVQLNAGASSFSTVSDRARKENFLEVDGEDLLLRLRGVPVTRWQYRAEEDRATWHVGPMAQDWHAAFALSEDPTTINMSDFDGVNLAAIQALERRTTEQAERIRTLEAELAELREAVRLLREERARQ
jgi:hypothetical protein